MRRRAAEEERGEEGSGSLSVALRRLKEAGVDAGRIAGALERAYVSPVLTAHPTEIQRKSILDAGLAIASLLTERRWLRGRDKARASEQLRARIAQLWQTRLLRDTKLSVRDEIDNAAGYYETTFLREIPAVYAELEAQLGRRVPPFLRMGNWIGGDRDGNPNVTAGTLRLAVGRHAEVVLRHYLGELLHCAASCRCRARCRASPPRSRRWPPSPATTTRTARTSPIAAPSSASMPVSPRPCAR